MANSLTKQQVTKMEGFKFTSTKVKFLHSLGFTTSEISKHLNIRYQWVRNVLTTPVKQPRESF